MNEMIWRVKYHLIRDEISPFDVTFRLNKTPMSYVKYGYPRDAFRLMAEEPEGPAMGSNVISFPKAPGSQRTDRNYCQARFFGYELFKIPITSFSEKRPLLLYSLSNSIPIVIYPLSSKISRKRHSSRKNSLSIASTSSGYNLHSKNLSSPNMHPFLPRKGHGPPNRI